MRKSMPLLKMVLLLAGITLVTVLCYKEMTQKKKYVIIKTRRTNSGAKGDVYDDSAVRSL